MDPQVLKKMYLSIVNHDNCLYNMYPMSSWARNKDYYYHIKLICVSLDSRYPFLKFQQLELLNVLVIYFLETSASHILAMLQVILPQIEENSTTVGQEEAASDAGRNHDADDVERTVLLILSYFQNIEQLLFIGVISLFQEATI